MIPLIKMDKVIFILGGARSGKSHFAVNMAKNAKKVAFIATCLPQDKEMKRRVALHKKTRPAHWQTFEEPEEIPILLKKIGSRFEVIIIDCLTLLVSNFMLKDLKGNSIENRIKEMLSVLRKIKAKSIIVSNEVGLGIVPVNKLARNFRDIVGRVNQIVAEESDEVLFMISGIPLKVKTRR